ncbi:MAG: YicC family protein [Deltaproteobacteria bacterium]|nr:YicC family protein [Deltaproteobacteria bacterium]
MPESMTGYGRASFSIKDDSFTIEVKSLNHRYLDFNIRMPDRFSFLEPKIKDEVKKRFSRGAVSVSVYYEESKTSDLKLNLQAAKAYLDAAEVLKKELGVKGDADIAVLLGTKEIFLSNRKALDLEPAWEAMKGALAGALQEAHDWRKKEGVVLKADISERLKSFEARLSGIEAEVPVIKEASLKRLREEIERLVKDRVTEDRLVTEAGILAQRADVSEELVRTKSHINMFRQYLERLEPVGKRLDFLCQELFREINTTASKSGSARVAQSVVEMKSELEKIREQVQNIE